MVRLNLTSLRRRFVEEARSLPSELEQALQADGRAGALAILEAVARRRRANRAEGQRLRTLLRFEQRLWADGLTLVAGIDEAGMSPLAGPVAAGAVILPVGWRAPGINDSKQLDAKKREALAVVIQRDATAFAVAMVEPDEIDKLNIYWAGLLAMERAVAGLGVGPQHLLIDARRLAGCAIPQTKIVKGDEKSLSIAAASILAKTARDTRMEQADALYPEYGFRRHKGYPVREHFAALQRHGPCPIHRLSFGPVQRALGLAEAPPEPEQARPEA